LYLKKSNGEELYRIGEVLSLVYPKAIPLSISKLQFDFITLEIK
jgi:hypothetical protein